MRELGIAFVAYSPLGRGFLTGAAVEACRLRLRPILMTSLAFILGVLPLVIAKGAGAEMRQSLGTAVFSGMLGVTFFGLFLTPVFYVVIRRVIERRTENTKVVSALANGAKTMAVMLVVFGLLTGCMVGPDYQEPRINLSFSFANRDQPGFSNQETELFWWRGFDDEKLNRLVDLAIAGNHDLRIAIARLREARALWSEVEFDRFPTVTSQGSYSRERQSKVRAPGV